MSYGDRKYCKGPETIQSRYEAACFKYLRYVFAGEEPWRVREAARDVYKYSPWHVLKSETVH
jgi:hypothetical protein